MKNKQKNSNKKLFISVIVCAFNEEKYLPGCLGSLSNQTYPKDKFSVTVVDNNSADKTFAIAKRYGAKIISEKQQGYVFALKKGLDTAQGDIIAVTDADCQVPKDWLEKIAVTFGNNNVVALAGLSTLNVKSKAIDSLTKILYHFFLKGTFSINRPNMSGSNCAIRKSVYREMGSVNINFTMSPDVDLGIRLKKHGRVIYLEDLVVSTSARRFEKRIFNALLEYGKGYIYSAWLRKPPPVKQAVIR